MKNKIFFLSFLTALLTSCSNDNYSKKNVSDPVKNNNKTNYQSEMNNDTRASNSNNNTNLTNPNYISSNYSNYDLDESIRNMEQENKVFVEKQMREIEKMKEGLYDFNSPKYKELENDRRVKEIMAESDRMLEEIKNVGSYKPYERPYIPDPVILPNSPNYRANSNNDYVNPYANPAKVDVSGYQKSNGTNVEAHIRTAPNDRVTDNLRY